MISKKTRDSLLALLGITAIAVYVLACRPSFSPDGSQVIFPVIDDETRRAVVYCYDINSGSTQRVLESSVVPEIKQESAKTASNRQNTGTKPPESLAGSKAKDGREALSVQWLPDGKHIVINDSTSITIAPVGTSGTIRRFQLQNEIDSGSLISPPPISGKYQFMLAEKFLLRVNLETGDILGIPNDRNECQLLGHGTQIYYLAKIGGDNQRDGYELGTVDLERLGLIPIFQVQAADADELNPFVGFAAAGNRLALTGSLDDAPRVLLFRDGRLERTLAIADKKGGLSIGNAEWSPDGETIYAAYVRKSGDGKNSQYGILEVPVSGAGLREIPLFASDRDNDSWALYFQVGLSPDGRNAVASSTCLGRNDLQPEDRALYIVDLTGPSRNAAKVVVPIAPMAKSPEPKQ